MISAGFGDERFIVKLASGAIAAGLSAIRNAGGNNTQDNAVYACNIAICQIQQ